LSTGK